MHLSQSIIWLYMLFYPSKTNDRLNGKPFNPESVNNRVMLNPKYPIRRLLPKTLAICDSGAFQDIGDGTRLLPWSALDRQLQMEDRLQWHLNDFEWHYEAICIYDQMAGVDEAIVNGRKIKIRGTRETAAVAVEQTLYAANYYASQRDRIRGRLMFAGQGIDADQYINDCIIPMLDIMQPDDWFAFGGFCIIGKRPKQLLPIFYETFSLALDVLKKKNINRVHLLGVCVPDAVTFAASEVRKHGMVVSTDSSAPEQNGSIFGRAYTEEGRQYQKYSKDQKRVDYHPADLALSNIRDYYNWSNNL